MFNKKLKNSFTNKQVIKIISGINNFNTSNIVKYVKTCEISNATYVDIAADPTIVSFVKKISNLPICVSSINIKSLYNSVLAGADIIEIGNFDIFYSKGFIISPQQIKNMSYQLRIMFPTIDICVTLPYWLSLDQQIKLAIYLESIGINIIQTEGHLSKDINSQLFKKYIKNYNLYNCVFKASSSLASVYGLSKNINLPIIASSRMNVLNSSIALSYGASGIGIKSSISNFSNITQMSSYINEIKYSLNISKTYRNIAKSKNNYYCYSNNIDYDDQMLFYNV
uniref:Uncharacterized protein ycf23 n=1 Tax=Centroceras clavulatum TaxID=159503 RepID=A0A4D6WRE5_9FLOR|nr:hypothetical protein [Centroceras clavulatum]